MLHVISLVGLFPWMGRSQPALSEIRVMSAFRANKYADPAMNRTCSATKVARHALRQDGGFYART